MTDDFKTEINTNRRLRRKEYRETQRLPVNGDVERWIPQADGTVKIVSDKEILGVCWPPDTSKKAMSHN